MFYTSQMAAIAAGMKLSSYTKSASEPDYELERKINSDAVSYHSPLNREIEDSDTPSSTPNSVEQVHRFVF